MLWGHIIKKVIPHKNNHFLNEKRAVSVVVSTILTLVIITGAVATIMFWGMPYLEERKMDAQGETAINSMLISSNTLKDLIIDGEDSTGVSTVKIDNKQGYFNVKKNGDKFIMWYSFDDDYSFNVSNLDDGDKTFNITMDGPPYYYDITHLDKLTVYCLDPDEIDETSKPNYPFIDPIFENIHYAQSFEAKGWDATRELDKISLYISKRGDPTDLNLSIFTYTGNPDYIGDFVYSKHISNEDIKNYPSWIDIDIGNLDLTVGSKYCIVLNTSKGCYNYTTSCYSYYSWRPYLNSPYEYGSLYKSSDSGDSWNSLSYLSDDYDFPIKLIYKANNTPEKPQIEMIDPASNLSGVDLDFEITSFDSEGDDIYYKIDWGDGNISDWMLAQSPPENKLEISHKWNVSGKYQMKVKCKDKCGNIALENTTEIDVKAGNNQPADFDFDKGFEKLTSSDLIYSYDSVEVILQKIDESYFSQARTIRIDLFDDDYPSSPLPTGKLPFGRIWVFDLGHVKITLPYQIGNHITYFTNGCVLTENPNNYRFKNNPFFFETDQAVSFRMIQLDDSSSGGGGVGDFNIRLEMKKNFNRERGYIDIYNLKLQVFGTNQKAWLSYLDRNYNFESYPGEDKLFYEDRNKEGKTLILHNSFVRINMGGYI